MSFVDVNGITLAYERRGQGRPLLLIAGLGCARWMWWRNIESLARDHDVIAFDNRGVGNTSAPEGPYSIQQMAEDACGLLNALGIEQADVLGISMGGYIAQELALAHPQRVRRLILGATGVWGGAATVEFQAAVARARGLPPKEFLSQLLPLLVGPGYWEREPEQRDQLLQMRLNALPQVHAYEAQVDACARHNTRDRLSELKVPSLVVWGAEDTVVPPEQGEQLAAVLSDVQTQIYPDAGHYFFAECAADFHQRIVEFLKDESTENLQ